MFREKRVQSLKNAVTSRLATLPQNYFKHQGRSLRFRCSVGRGAHGRGHVIGRVGQDGSALRSVSLCVAVLGRRRMLDKVQPPICVSLTAQLAALGAGYIGA